MCARFHWVFVTGSLNFYIGEFLWFSLLVLCVAAEEIEDQDRQESMKKPPVEVKLPPQQQEEEEEEEEEEVREPTEEKAPKVREIEERGKR